MHAARISASVSPERSVETLIVVAPSSCSTCAVAPFVHGSKTDVFSTSSGGRSPARPHPAERREHADVADEVRADPVGEAAPHLGEALLDARLSASRHAHGRGGERLSASVPGAARAEEERHLDAVLPPEPGPSRRARASVSIITPEPCETRRTGTPRSAASSSTARITTGPSTEGISIR